MAQTGNASHRGHNASGASERAGLTFQEVLLHTHMAYDFALPSHQFGKVRDKSDRTAKKEKKKKARTLHPRAWKQPQLPPARRGAGWACYTAGRRTHASHVNGAPTHTQTYETHTHTPTHTCTIYLDYLVHTHIYTHAHTTPSFSLWLTRATAHQPSAGQPDPHGGARACHTRGSRWVPRDPPQ